MLFPPLFSYFGIKIQTFFHFFLRMCDFCCTFARFFAGNVYPRMKKAKIYV